MQLKAMEEHPPRHPCLCTYEEFALTSTWSDQCGFNLAWSSAGKVWHKFGQFPQHSVLLLPLKNLVNETQMPHTIPNMVCHTPTQPPWSAPTFVSCRDKLNKLFVCLNLLCATEPLYKRHLPIKDTCSPPTVIQYWNAQPLNPLH